MVRIQVPLAEHEREEFRRLAAAEGLSLSAGLREAGRARSRGAGSPALRSVEDLRAFVAERATREQGREPDWDEHRAVIERSRGNRPAPARRLGGQRRTRRGGLRP